jgi:hypothetical protein
MHLRHVLPGLAMYHSADDPVATAVLLRQLADGHQATLIPRPHVEYVPFVEPGPVMSGPSQQHSPSTLRDHVLVVVQVGADKEVIRADARTDITAMQNTQAVGDRAVGQFVGKTMGTNRLVMLNVEPSISIPIEARGPKPAWTEFRISSRNWTVLVNLRPESAFNREKQRRGLAVMPTQETLVGAGRPSATTGAGDESRIGLHSDLQCRCAKPRAVSAAPRYLLACSLAHMCERGR